MTNLDAIVNHRYDHYVLRERERKKERERESEKDREKVKKTEKKKEKERELVNHIVWRCDSIYIFILLTGSKRSCSSNNTR